MSEAKHLRGAEECVAQVKTRRMKRRKVKFDDDSTSLDGGAGGTRDSEIARDEMRERPPSQVEGLASQGRASERGGARVLVELPRARLLQRRDLWLGPKQACVLLAVA